uniref:Uncharacterized protein n=1 Tax=Zea mays TaxID=4577 RepID=A0A804PTX5_MAIZE
MALVAARSRAWCQRSSQCPMCWQHISMKDPMSQELLEAVEQERNIRANPSRNTVVFHHPMLGDFEIPVGADDAELEERIIQHLAAAAAVRRSHRHHNRRDGHQSRSGASSHPHFLVLSADERTISGQEGDYEQAPAETCNTQQEQFQTFQKQLAVATEKLKSLAKFMSKATGNAVNLVQIVGMKDERAVAAFRDHLASHRLLPDKHDDYHMMLRFDYRGVPHVQQAFTWDYGLACVLMVLRTLGIDCCDNIADLERLCRTTRLGSKVAMFQYSSVEIYNACKPQPTLEIHNPDMHKDAPSKQSFTLFTKISDYSSDKALSIPCYNASERRETGKGEKRRIEGHWCPLTHRGASSSAAQRLTVDAGLPVLPGLDDILDVPEGLDGQGNDISSWFTDGLDDSLQDIDLSGALEIPDDDLTQLGFIADPLISLPQPGRSEDRDSYCKMMHKYIGSDVISLVTLPVIIFEPMTMLQKMAELSLLLLVLIENRIRRQLHGLGGLTDGFDLGMNMLLGGDKEDDGGSSKSHGKSGNRKKHLKNSKKRKRH